MRAAETLRVGEAVSSPAPSERPMLAAVALGTMLAPLNATMIAIALSKIAEDFGVSVRAVGWIVVSYLIGMAVTQPIGGKLGDLFGRRRVFLAALTGFLFASIGAALAPNLPTLLAMRVGQALSSAMAIPNGAALVRQWVPERRRAGAFGLVGASAGLAAGIGPPLGSGFIALGGWRAMFWANIPLVAVTMWLAWRTFPRSRGEGSARAFDYGGAALLAAALTSLALMATAISKGSAGAIAGVAAATVLLTALFFMHERAAAQPLVSLGLFKVRNFSAATASILLSNMAMYGTLLVVPLFLIDVQGRSAAQAGEALAAMSLPVVLVSPFGGRLADRLGRRTPAVLGGAITLAGLLPFLAVGQGWSIGLVETLLAVVGTGMALQLPAIQTAAVETVSARDAGMASGIYSLGRYTGSITGSAVLAAIIGTGEKGSSVTIGAVSTVFVMVAVAGIGAALTPLWLRRR